METIWLNGRVLFWKTLTNKEEWWWRGLEKQARLKSCESCFKGGGVAYWKGRVWSKRKGLYNQKKSFLEKEESHQKKTRQDRRRNIKRRIILMTKQPSFQQVTSVQDRRGQQDDPLLLFYSTSKPLSNLAPGTAMALVSSLLDKPRRKGAGPNACSPYRFQKIPFHTWKLGFGEKRVENKKNWGYPIGRYC